MTGDPVPAAGTRVAVPAETHCPAPSPSPGYRPEIDGLRALAVIPVMLFHAGIDGFRGGYVGVDIFFVISGYLISAILISGMRSAQFSFVDFYERRVRRILPALFVVLAACLPFVWWWSMPQDARNFSASLIAVAGFVSNIYFWRTNGYFDQQAETIPLLHTWSLSIEEQFYLVFPVVLWWVLRQRSRLVFLLLSAVAIVSLLVAQWGAWNKPEANFYLLPTRSWEFLIGALLALHHADSGRVRRSGLANQLPGLLGIGLIVFAITSFDQSTPFPGLMALIPTLGAALVIYAAHPANAAGWLLASRPMAGIGLISYSAYLWHQPVFALARQRSLDEPGQMAFLGLGVFSLGLAWVTWKFVEQPWRDRRRFARRHVFAAAVSGSVALIAIGITGVLAGGFPGRLSQAEQELVAFADYDYARAYGDGHCFLSRSNQNYRDFSADCSAQRAEHNSLIWGDSHAAALAPGLRLLLPHLGQFTASGCSPLLDQHSRQVPNCEAINNFVLSEIGRVKPQRIFIHANWTSPEQRRPSEALARTLAAIAQVSPASRVVVIGSVPQWHLSLPTAMIRRGMTLQGNQFLEIPEYALLAASDAALASSATSASALFVSSLQSICESDRCPVTVVRDGKAELTAWDYGHLTEAGSELLARSLLKQLQ